MEPEIISREHIKPSSPTPDHHRTHQLSLMDQIVPPIYVPLVLYYPAGEDNVIPKNHIDDDFISQTTQSLKQSLSETLTRFYPFAGRVKDKLSVDCSDEGALFVVARFAGVCLSDFLKNPDPIASRAHIPSELKWDEPGPGSYVTMIQVNFFDCGGVAIGSLFLHKVADGVSIGTFMKAWGATTRRSSDDQEKKLLPDYTAKSFFPQNEAMQRDSHLFSAMRKYFKFGKTVMRRYVFDAPAISSLRDKLAAASSGGLEFRPSRVEIVSALLWECFIVAATKSGSDKNLSLVTHGVNMRRKVEPTFPDTSFGNFVWLVPASSSNETIPEQLKDLVVKVRNAIAKVDEDFVRRMQGKEGFSGYSKNLEGSWSEFPEEADYLAISSWCNFGLYSIDFGWGRPAWISKCDGGSDVAWPFINVLWLMDTRKGDGIEAWLTLDEHYIAAFDDIQELKDLASIDPSPRGNDI